MKYTSRLAFALFFTTLFSFAAHSQIRQTHLYIDDGSGNFTILSAPSGGGAVTLPASGTILTSASAWTLTGNSGTTPGTDFIGTTDNVALEFKQHNMISGILDQTKRNAGFGYSALQNDLTQTGTDNTAVGYFAGLQLTTGLFNTAIGSNALFTVATSNSNTAIGYTAMQSAANGSHNNTAVGVGALFTGTFNNCTALGSGASVTGGFTDATAIGYSAVATASDMVQLGDVNVTQVNSNGAYTTGTALGGVTTPTAGTYYKDNAIVAWGEVPSTGTAFTNQFGNSTIDATHTTGVYNITLPTGYSAVSVTVTLESSGIATASYSGSGTHIVTVSTYNVDGTTASDHAFFYQVVARP